MNQLPPPLVELLAQRRCLLFLGPDAAESANGYRGLPTSHQLAWQLAEQSNYRGRYRPLPQMAQLFERSHGRSELHRFLGRALKTDQIAPLPIHEVAARLPFAAVVDAGWDDLLERALRGQGVAHEVITGSAQLPYAAAGEKLLVYKPFGSLQWPDTLLVTEDDQLNLFRDQPGLQRRLTDLVASHGLLMVGYAPDYDSVFVRIYHAIRQEQAGNLPPAYVVSGLDRPEDAAQWQSRGLQAISAEPVAFLYALAQSQRLHSSLPPLDALSQAPRLTDADLTAQSRAVVEVMETLGITDLVEQTDVPLLSPQQVRDMEAMMAAYGRLSENTSQVGDSAQVWLRQGNIDYARQNYAQAEASYRKALAAQPQLASAYHNLHYVHLAQNRLDDAFAAYQQAVALQPELAILPPFYAIDLVLGRGGVGVVYRATDERSGRTVAVKVLDRAFMRTESVIRRFEREADLLRRLAHPHIVTALEFAQYQGRHYLVTEYLGEQTLEALLAQTGPLPIDRAFALFEQMCQPLSFAHSHQIIHRDIKPANIFVLPGSGGGEQVKLIDFGLAQDLSAGQPSLLGQISGTVAYMAPEQSAGQAVDARTDLFALATVFYEMITGRFPGQAAYQTPGELQPGLNDTLEIVLSKARSHAPADRYPDVESFRAELARVIPLQPASRAAPGWLRGLGQAQQVLSGAADRYRLIWIGLVLVAGLTPWPVGTAGALVKSLGFLAWDVLLLTTWAGWYTVRMGRRSGYGSLAAFGALYGALLGVGVGAVILAFPVMFDWQRPLGVTELLIALLTHTLFCVLVGGFALAAMEGGVRLSLRLGVNPRLGQWAGALAVLALYGWALAILNGF